MNYSVQIIHTYNKKQTKLPISILMQKKKNESQNERILDYWVVDSPKEEQGRMGGRRVNLGVCTTCQHVQEMEIKLITLF